LPALGSEFFSPMIFPTPRVAGFWAMALFHHARRRPDLVACPAGGWVAAISASRLVPVGFCVTLQPGGEPLQLLTPDPPKNRAFRRPGHGLASAEKCLPVRENGGCGNPTHALEKGTIFDRLNLRTSLKGNFGDLRRRPRRRNAGLDQPATLVRSISGCERLFDEYVHLGDWARHRQRRAQGDDSDLLGSGGGDCDRGRGPDARWPPGEVLGHGVRAPHARDFIHGDRSPGTCRPAGTACSTSRSAVHWAAGAGPGQGRSPWTWTRTICETYGLIKQRCRLRYTSRRGLSPTSWRRFAGTEEVVGVRLRGGQRPYRSGRSWLSHPGVSTGAPGGGNRADGF